MSNVIGLSALRAASEGIDATSNNIANAQTIGYKSGQYIFQDEFFRATDPQNPSRTGMGVTASHIRRSQTNGTIIATETISTRAGSQIARLIFFESQSCA